MYFYRIGNYPGVTRVITMLGRIQSSAVTDPGVGTEFEEINMINKHELCLIDNLCVSGLFCRFTSLCLRRRGS